MKIDPAQYDAWYGTTFGSLCHRLEKDALFSLVSFNPGDKVLDAGCGTGVYLEELLRLGLNVTGVDEDEDMLEYSANSRGKGATLIKAALQVCLSILQHSTRSSRFVHWNLLMTHRMS